MLFSADVLTGALVVAVIVLVQGAGVSEAAPNPDGAPPDIDADFRAQGIGNIAAALFRGQPVGGSVGQTALNAAAGARTRWAAIFSGVWMLAILIALSGLVGNVAMPSLAAILIFAAVSSVKPDEIRMALRTGPSSDDRHGDDVPGDAVPADRRRRRHRRGPVAAPAAEPRSARPQGR